jgi:cytochrome oxidase Cu insertion factor (SCO1/SenC/PrrC family)
VQRIAIRFGEDCNRRDAEFLTGTIDSQRDLASVGYEYLTKNFSYLFARLSARH